MRGARILDVDIVLVSPNNNDRPIEDSCPACVMRMVNYYSSCFILCADKILDPISDQFILIMSSI